MTQQATERQAITCSGTFTVPRHINRQESPATPGRGETRTWQVRFDRKDEPYFSKTFSDGVYGGTEEALNEAIICLEAIQQNYRYTEQINTLSSDTNTLFWRNNPSRPSQQELWASVYLCSYNNQRCIISFFVCTENNYTEKKEAQADAIGQYLREWASEVIEEEGRDILAGYTTGPKPYEYLKITKYDHD